LSVRLKRAYQEPARSDGYRVLVDRLWPRGVRREALRLDAWARELAPSATLRSWFGHDPARFPEFARRYAGELRSGPGTAALADLARRSARGTVTLVYGARDEQHSNAAVLRDLIEDAVREHV
jgi:uncharacterized protein YeaO (DUF488 family)